MEVNPHSVRFSNCFASPNQGLILSNVSVQRVEWHPLQVTGPHTAIGKLRHPALFGDCFAHGVGRSSTYISPTPAPSVRSDTTAPSTSQ